MSFIRRATKDFLVQDRWAALYFDLSVIRDNARFLQSQSGDNVRFLFPVKSFPWAPVLSSVSPFLNGFDVSNAAEANIVSKFMKAGDKIWNSAPYKCSLPCEAIHDLSTPVLYPGSASLRIHLDSDKKPSRFGTAASAVTADLLRGAGISALHFHHGSEDATPSSYLAMIDELSRIFSKVSFLRDINLGGGLGNFTRADISQIVACAREKFPEKNIYFEPGRWITSGAGICIGKVLDVNASGPRLQLVTSISREAHLKWTGSHFNLKFMHLREIDGNKLMARIGGPTCDENDRLLECEIDAGVANGDLIILENMSGYSAAWNHSFNGLPPAEIIFLEEVK